MSTDFSYLNIPEEHAKAYLVLETEFRHVHTALEEVLRYFGYCQSLLQAVKEVSFVRRRSRCLSPRNVIP